MSDEKKPEFAVIEGGKEDTEMTPTVSDNELDKFYEDNKDAIDLMGGLEVFETLFKLSDEEFETLKPEVLKTFTDTLNEKQSEQEIIAMVYAQDYTAEKIAEDSQTAIKAINEVDFLSETKKDFLRQIFSLFNNKVQLLIGQANEVVEIPCETDEGVELPAYANDGDAGLDIYSLDEYTINPGETKIIPTGIKCAIPKGYAILIQPRSGQSAKTKLRIANTPGLIDSGYRDEIGVIVENIEPPFKDIDYEFDDNGEIHIKSILHGQSYTITQGQRFAQMRLVKVPTAAFVSVNSVANLGENRGGGFGHTGE